MTMSSTNELPVDFSFFGPRRPAVSSCWAPPAAALIWLLLLLGVAGGLGVGLGGRGRLGGRLAAGLGGRGVRRLDLRHDLLDRRAVGVDGALARGRLGLELGGGVVQQTGLDDLLGADVAALPDAGGLADAVAEVVQLGATHVTAGGDVDLLDLRRVHGERALHADAEGLLADREGLADTVPLALDHHAFEDLRTATRALDDLEVDTDAVTGLEGRDAAQLGALKGVDDSAHGKEKARRSAPRVG